MVRQWLACDKADPTWKHSTGHYVDRSQLTRQGKKQTSYHTPGSTPNLSKPRVRKLITKHEAKTNAYQQGNKKDNQQWQSLAPRGNKKPNTDNHRNHETTTTSLGHLPSAKYPPILCTAAHIFECPCRASVFRLTFRFPEPFLVIRLRTSGRLPLGPG